MDRRLVMLAGAIGIATAPSASAADLPPRPDVVDMMPTLDFAGYLTNVYAHVGPAGIFTEGSAKVSTPLGRYPGATIKIGPQVTASAEAARLT